MGYDSVKEYFSSLDITTVYGFYAFNTIISVRERFDNLQRLRFLQQYKKRNRTKLNMESIELIKLYSKKPLYIGSKLYSSLPENTQHKKHSFA